MTEISGYCPTCNTLTRIKRIVFPTTKLGSIQRTCEVCGVTVYE